MGFMGLRYSTYMTKHFKRIFTDTAGYLLIVAGIATGWLPGPGGIPLILGGLGLLSIHNTWAARLRDYLIRHGATFLQKIFPENHTVQLLYDALAIVLLAFVAYLAWNHDPLWQLSIAVTLFIVALIIAGMNRGRVTRIKERLAR